MGPALRLAAVAVVTCWLAACQSTPRTAGVASAPPAPPPPRATHVLSMSLTCGHPPPCEMGTVQDMATGEVMTIYDVDLEPLGLDDLQRSALRRSLDGNSTQIEGRVENRADVPMADGPLPVLVVTGLPQQS
ncbi:MAG: hypothetical protein H6843_01855 [Rhodospirillaceae bacterium]|nr:hypothetical protein [Rhodospirillaceae bacterium]